VSALGLALFLPGVGQMSFRDALLDLAPYSPRAAYNFIDPANSLFQGTTLTTVTSATNPVGLVIDQTQGGLGNLGAELVTNGGFDSDTDWTKGTGWTISGGVASRPNIGSGTSLTQAVALTANSLYLLTYTLTQTSGNFNTAFQGGSSVFGPNRTTGGTYTEVLRAVSGSNTLAFQAGSTFAGTIDNVSLRLIPGNHATASSDAKRPLFARYPATGRRNLLISTEDLDVAAWTKNAATISPNTETAPDGTLTADKLVANNTVGLSSVSVVQSITKAASAIQYTYSLYAKALDFDRLQIVCDSGAFTNRAVAVCSLIDGSVVSAATAVGTFSSASVDVVPNIDGWYRISLTFMTGTETVVRHYIQFRNSGSETGDGIKGSFAWGAQLELGSTATNYQKVVTSADITEAGVRDVYASLYDGADDCLQVSGFDLSNTDEVTVIAGVRKLSDAAGGTIAELSATISANNGAFQMLGPNGANPNYLFRSRGTTERVAISANSFSSPITNFLVGVGDISGDVCRLLINGTQVATDTADQGTGNYGNYTLNIGMRNNASLPFNGYIHYLFICGAIVPDSVLTKIYRGLGPRIGLTV